MQTAEPVYLKFAIEIVEMLKWNMACVILSSLPPTTIKNETLYICCSGTRKPLSRYMYTSNLAFEWLRYHKLENRLCCIPYSLFETQHITCVWIYILFDVVPTPAMFFYG